MPSSPVRSRVFPRHMEPEQLEVKNALQDRLPNIDLELDGHLVTGRFQCRGVWCARVGHNKCKIHGVSSDTLNVLQWFIDCLLQAEVDGGCDPPADINPGKRDKEEHECHMNRAMEMMAEEIAAGVGNGVSAQDLVDDGFICSLAIF